uniref:Calcineurin like EF-hand protein 1 n=1 Tax=Oryzias sinensis TaxID=183150 RepID=A0A8C7WYQ0_9TELE
MGSRASTLLREEEIEEIKKETGFSHSQITRLYSRFTSLDKGENGTRLHIGGMAVHQRFGLTCGFKPPGWASCFISHTAAQFLIGGGA